MTGPQPKAPPKKVPPTKPTKRAGMGKQDPKYLRAYRVRTGRQKSLPIPVCVLKEAIGTGDQSPLLQYLGPEMVEAVKEATE